MNAPANGIILAGLHSSSGKTAVTSLLLAALRARQLPVQAFKVGPDFIDPGYLTFFSGSPTRNLDAWLMGESGIRAEVACAGAGKISVVEGVMGLFDGSEIATDEGSAMALARLLNWPVVLVVPSGKAGRSLAAALRGFVAEAGPGRICGFILNQVSGDSHASYLRQAIAPLNIPVLGAVPACDELRWPERHLGLQAGPEMELPSVETLARLAERFLDVNQLVSMLAPAPSAKAPQPSAPTGRRLALARDAAFHFYYESNLEHLRRAGVELVEFSPLHDRALPADVGGLIFGGGFPEVFAEQLAANQSLRGSVRDAIKAGLPCYAECGGLMFLAEEIITLEGEKYPMAGVIPGAIEMTRRLNHFGYCSGQTESGATLRGHEFHYSRWLGESEHANRWLVTQKSTGRARQEGFRSKNLHASYVHLHFSTGGAVVDSLFGLSPETEHAAARQPIEELQAP